MPRIVILEDPLSAREHNNLGVAYEKKGKLELAEKEYRKAIKKDKNWDIPYFNLGNIYFKKKEYRKAEEYYRKAIQLNPKNSDAMNNLSYLLYLQGKIDEAYRLIKRAISIKFKPEYIDTLKEIEEKIYESN
ncbi:Tetratricopeptide repeat-containing protein [Persephonella hydrogeniphila]|uniref:Tetratricopeptide repeat-containing protein n=1 Tax=Persephonella hydrogeniphila TaxID=198703 RepID=A0A285NNP8_9AQUI|nr:tetratricopeptide repeat protein [Persephonella hydrogeniphila]SNZ10587.1 Tetratricopeptide repeat-containing protein [Persephonella hydrogeniphila]